jgi:hypothetical protein
MYAEGGDEGAAPMLGSGRRFNLEGLIPLVLLVIIGIASLNYFGVIDIPYLPKGSTRIQVLVIGDPSMGEKAILDNLTGMVTYRIRDASSFSYGASEELHQYNIVILDQSNTADKSVTISLAEAIKTYVSKGGKLIIVKNSGIYQSVGFAGLRATDVTNWKANFGKIVPADCVLGPDNVPTCAPDSAINMVGRIYTMSFDHPIMSGIEITPPAGDIPYSLETFPIQANEGATTIAFIKAENSIQSVPAILEKKAFPLGGTVIYFNYDPGLTLGIFKNTLLYLR